MTRYHLPQPGLEKQFILWTQHDNIMTEICIYPKIKGYCQSQTAAHSWICSEMKL